MTNEDTQPVHECKGNFQRYLSEPVFSGWALSEGEPYMGQHVSYNVCCVKCDAVVEVVSGHRGPCHQGQELELLGSHWNVKHQQFVFKKGETPSWRCWQLSNEQRLEISSYYRGWLDAPPKIKVTKTTSF